MLSNRQLFLKYVAQTSDLPIMLEIDRAEGIWIFDPEGRKYADLISGVSVSNLGHGNQRIIQAVKDQLDKHMHLMVYGEYIQDPQVGYAKLLAENLPERLDCCYFVNSGSEAVEGALKLAKRLTGRPGIVAFKNAYHGSTHGALSVLGDEYYKNAFRPLLPGVSFLSFNDARDLNRITTDTACVIIEPIQAEAGVILPETNFHKSLRERCSQVGALLIFDEIQVGFGRTGKLFAFENYGVAPDVIVLAKSLGGGLPLGAFISSAENMAALKHDPVLGHITTFGGHPVSCAAGLQALKILLEGDLLNNVSGKEKIFRKMLQHKAIKEIRGKGLLLAVELGNGELVRSFLENARSMGVISDYFLFSDTAFRISPPLTITEEEITEVCNILRFVLDKI